MNDDQTARKLMEDGWKAREKLDFDSAEFLLNKAKELFEKNGDWFNVTECLNHLAYTRKLMAQKTLREGEDLISESEKISRKNQTKDSLVLRAKMSLLDAQGQYEEAMLIAEELLARAEKPNFKSDVLSHLATFALRTGSVEVAEKFIKDSDKNLKKAWNAEREPHRSILKCRNLMLHSLISYNKEDYKSARKFADEALKIATTNDLKTRAQEAKDLTELIDLQTKP